MRTGRPNPQIHPYNAVLNKILENSIEEIDFADVIYASEFTLDYMKLLAAALAQNTSMHTLKFHSSLFTGENGSKLLSALAEGLKTNKGISVLNLTCAGLHYTNSLYGSYASEDKGFKDLMYAIKENNTITKLYLTDNRNLGNNAFSLLAETLKDNKTITHLYLGNTEISRSPNWGANNLFLVPNSLPSLTTLDLQDNNITIDEDVARQFVKEIETRSAKLTKIYLQGNNITVEGRAILQQAGLNLVTGQITRRVPAPVINPAGPLINGSAYQSHLCLNKSKMILASTVALCALVVCYKKPEILTNIADLFSSLVQNVSGFVMGK